MGYVIGEGAAMDGFNCLTRFEVWDIGESADIVCTASAGGPIAVVGNDDWAGKAMGMGVAPYKYPGETFTFKYALSGEVGRSGSAIMQLARMKWEVEAGLPLEHEIEFRGTAAMSTHDDAVTDSGSPSGTSAKGLGVRIDDTLFSVRRMLLEVECKNPKINDTSTAGHTYRIRGKYEARFRIEAYYDDPDDLPARSTYKQLLFQTVTGADETTGWGVDYGFMDVVKDNIPVQSKADGEPEAVYALIAGHWSAYYGTTQGSITMPDGTQIWPIQ